MRFICLFIIIISCNKLENCELSYYPSPPYGNPDDTIYYDNSVRYLYVCWNDSGFNKVYTYEIVGECWELTIDENYNFNC